MKMVLKASLGSLRKKERKKFMQQNRPNQKKTFKKWFLHFGN
jgi:hypothetical protein